MRYKNIPLAVTIIVLLFHFSCKTSESIQSNVVSEQTQQELLQSSIDTNSSASLSDEEIQRITLMAHEAARLYCSMKQFEGKDMKDIKVAKAFDPLDQEFSKIQKEANKLNSMGKLEYDRVFEKAKTKCE